MSELTEHLEFSHTVATFRLDVEVLSADSQHEHDWCATDEPEAWKCSTCDSKITRLTNH